jgi:hypothetical protein
MKIGSDSAAGRALQRFGVSAGHLDSTIFWGWRRPFINGGLTVALPLGSALVIIESRYLRTNEDGALLVDRQLALLRHELCHVQQAAEWGFLGYWRRHLWARFTSLSMKAADTPVESGCYDALDQVRAVYPDFIDR